MGAVEQNVSRDVGDFVVCRADGVPAYQLAVVVDDALMEITEVVRGADLLLSTPRQIALYDALAYTPPRFLHVPLVLDAQGARLAKRQDAVGVGALRAAGLGAEHVVGALAASVGMVASGEQVTARALSTRLDLARLSREPSAVTL